MSSVKSYKRGRKEIDREKKEILKRLQKIRKTYDQISQQTKEIIEQATNAGNQLLDERSKSKFWLKLGPLTSVITQSYGHLVNISSRLPTEDDESDSSSDSSQASLGSIISMTSMRSSMSATGFNLSCGAASTSNASCQTPMDPKGAGDAKAMKKPSRTNVDNSQLPPRPNQESCPDKKEPEEIKTENETKPNCKNEGTGNGTGKVHQTMKKAHCLPTGTEKACETILKSPMGSLKDLFPSVDNTPRAICSADGVYHLASNATKAPLVNYETESLASYERDDVNNIEDNDNDNDEDLEEGPDMLEPKQSDSMKITENQSIVTSASSSNEAFSVSFSNLSVLSAYNSPLTVAPALCSIGSTVEVVVLDVQTPSDFWVQFLGQDTNVRLDFLMRHHCNGPNAEKPGKNLSIGLHCCVWDDAEDLWFRAEVKRICYNWENESPSTCNLIQNVEVRYLDVGTLNVVSPDKLCSLSKECSIYPATAMHCKLAQIIPYDGVEWSSDANAKFHNWVHENVFQMTLVNFMPDGLAVVELEEGTKQNVMNVGKRLIEKKLAKYEEEYQNLSNRPFANNKEPEVKSVVRMPSIESLSSTQTSQSEDNGVDDEFRYTFTWAANILDPELPAESEFCLSVSHVNSPTSFYAILKENGVLYHLLVEQLERFEKEYNETVLPPIPLNVTVGTYWAAKSLQDGRWHRGLVIEVKKPKRCRRRTDVQKHHSFHVHYVDYGDKEWLTITELRPLLEYHCVLPAFAVHFALANVRPASINKGDCVTPREEWDWSKEAIEKFNDLIISDNQLIAKIIPEIIREKSELSKNSPIPINLSTYDQINSETINNLLIASGFASMNDLNGKIDEIGEWNNWNPLNDVYCSTQNNFGTTDVGLAVTGYRQTDDQRICHSFNRGLCNDPFCRFEHTYLTDVTTDLLPRYGNLANISDNIQPGMVLAVFFSAIDNPGHFFLVLPYGIKDVFEHQETDMQVDEDGIFNLSSLMTRLHNKCSKSHDYDDSNIIYEGELVAAKCDDVWYRVKVLEDDDTRQTITGVCVDYGDTVQIDRKDIRPLPAEFMHFPSQAVECHLWDVDPIDKVWSEEAIRWFEDRIGRGDHTFIITIENVFENLVYVTIHDPQQNCSINEELVSYGFGSRIDVQSKCVNSVKG